MIDKDEIAVASVAPAPKRKRATATRKAKKPAGRKTMIAAVTALVIAVVDLFLLVRLGINLF